MTENRPLVSIIVRTKDRPKLLKRALQSIADQTYRPIEIVLVNDGGCDLAIEEIKNILGAVSLNYVRLEKNTGRAHAGNVGVDNAKGKYLGFLDDDDEFYSEHVETLVSFLEQSDYKVAYTDTEMFFKDFSQEDEKMTDINKSIFSKDFSYKDLLVANYIPFNSILFDKTILISAGGLDEGFELYEDWDLLIRVGEKYPFHHINRISTKYIQWSRELQINQSNAKIMRTMYVRVLEKHRQKIDSETIVDMVYEKSRVERELNASITAAANLETEIRARDDLISQISRSNREKDLLISQKDLLISQLEQSTKEAGERISQVEGVVLEKNTYISELENTIYLMRNTLGWKVLEKGRKFRERLLPRGKSRRKIYDLAIKSFRVMSEQGLGTFIAKTRRKLDPRLQHVQTAFPDWQAKRDVLFVSGCPGDALRYRCEHQIEQLEKQGLTCSFVLFDQADLISMIPFHHFFILHRVPINDHVSSFIHTAQSQNKVVIFDTDDLVFDESYGAFVNALNDMSPSEKALYYDGLRRYGMTLRLCEYAITTTEYLANEIRKTGRTVFINRNAVSDEMVGISEKAYRNRPASSGRNVTIGYFSGTPTHDGDFALVAGALLKIMEKYEFAGLLVAGHLKLPEEFSKFESRVRRNPLVPWRELPNLKAAADINIAPLERNPFCESKSELKYLEAALVGVPTVASSVGGFKSAIRNGINGFLAEGETEWVDALSFLIENPVKRIEIGERAKKEVLDNYTTACMGKNFKQILDSIRRSRIDRDSLDIGWVLQAPFKGSGGYTTIFRMISFLRQFGHESTVYLDPIAHLSGKTDEEVKKYVQGYFGNDCKIVVGHDHIGTHDVLIATAWPTASTVVNSKWSFKKTYFVQDHEPDFYSPHDSNYTLSKNTYKLGLPCLTIGPYLSKLLDTRYGARTGFFDFSIDRNIYFPAPLMPEKGNQTRKIIFYARPETRRRGFDMGIRALQKVYKQYPEIEICLYGSDGLAQHKVPFPYNNLGVVAPAELGERYRESDIGLSISLTNLSLVPLEMMACGCVVVEIDSARCEGTLKNRENSLLADPTADGIADAICELLKNEALYERLYVNGISFAAERTHERAARQFEGLLLKEIDSAVAE